jgi:hypothetical protein
MGRIFTNNRLRYNYCKAHVTMLVYHFLSSHYGLEDIRERRLKISRIVELNDPFEFLGVDLSDREFRKAMKETKAQISKTKGLLCFSKTWKNPLLWGHYADKHRGICLGFEVSGDILEKVTYVKERFPRPAVFDEEFMKKVLFTKFDHWRYEQEYRVYIDLNEEINGIYYAEFSDQICLKRVIVGEQSDVTRVQVTDALGKISKEVEMFKARAGFKAFEVVRNKNQAMWA